MMTRREALRTAALGMSARWVPGMARAALQEPGARPARPEGVAVRNPRERAPLSLILDDSTCLVNLAHFAIPQFAEVFPNEYHQPWRDLPREIPDAFVRKFGQWCHQHGVKGKYSIVPYPACVGWIDREMPGWSRADLENSLRLVRELMTPDWDIHPEMVSHTWVIDPETGRPYPERSDRFMENWRWTDNRSADEIARYIAYALKPLKAVGLPCEGVTTPGGFGNRVLPQLARATLDACRDVFQAEIPHYFRHLFTDDRSVAPRVEYAAGLETDHPECVVSIIGCTGDWFGGWDGLEPGRPDQFITEDGRGGRLPEVIARGEPAILVGHWPGFYFNGREVGFEIFQEVVRRLEAHHPDALWMKLSEIARYWAARELTRIEPAETGLALHAPFACPAFTVAITDWKGGPPRLAVGGAGDGPALEEVRGNAALRPGAWRRDGTGLVACFDLPRGDSRLVP